MTRTDQLSRELIDNIQPARVQAYALQAALRDQETAVRGYVITADRQFLDPYYAGQDAERQAAENVRERVGTRAELIADLDAIEQARRRWRTAYAEPRHRRRSSGAPPAPPAASLTDRGKSEFDRLRALFDRQNENLRAARTDGIDAARPDAALARRPGHRHGGGVRRPGGRAGAAGAKRGHPAAGRPGRGVPAHHRGQLRRAHHPARAAGHPRHRGRRRGHAAAHRRRT